MIALLEAYYAKAYNKQSLLGNIFAGVIVGLVALPLAMAFAIASGVQPIHGLYTAVVAGLVVSICGGSRVQIAGPTGAFVVILAQITAEYGFDGLQVATLMAGAILCVLGLLRCGAVLKFIPAPVILGFTAGIAVIIWVSEWKDFFGLTLSLPKESFYLKFMALCHALPQAHGTTTLFATLCLLALIILPRYLRVLPAPVIVIVLATVAQAYFQFPGVATIGSTYGRMSASFPALHWPHCSFERLLELVQPAFTIAMLGAIESLLSALVADGMLGTRHQSNQELIGQGMANCLTPLFGGFAATGAIARTATNIRHGGNNPIAGVVHSLTVLLFILLLAPYAVYIPLCVLAAVLFVVSYHMSECGRFISMLRSSPKTDVFILLLTFILTVLVNLVVAVNVGVMMAALLFMQRMAQTVQVQRDEAVVHMPVPAHTQIYTVEGPLFFAAAAAFEQTLLQVDPLIHTVILRLQRVPFMDASGLLVLQQIIRKFHQRKVRVYVCEVSPLVSAKLARADILSLLQQATPQIALHDLLEQLLSAEQH